MTFTTVGSIKSLKFESEKASIIIKGLADYSTRIGETDYLLLVYADNIKKVKSDTMFTINKELLSNAMSLFMEAFRSKWCFKFTLEEIKIDDSEKASEEDNKLKVHEITSIETYDEKNKMA